MTGLTQWVTHNIGTVYVDLSPNPSSGAYTDPNLPQVDALKLATCSNTSSQMQGLLNLTVKIINVNSDYDVRIKAVIHGSSDTSVNSNILQIRTNPGPGQIPVYIGPEGQYVTFKFYEGYGSSLPTIPVGGSVDFYLSFLEPDTARLIAVAFTTADLTTFKGDTPYVLGLSTEEVLDEGIGLFWFYSVNTDGIDPSHSSLQYIPQEHRGTAGQSGTDYTYAHIYDIYGYYLQDIKPIQNYAKNYVPANGIDRVYKIPYIEDNIADTVPNSDYRAILPSSTAGEFIGWSTSRTATSAQYNPGQRMNLNQQVSLYAVYQPGRYTVTFHDTMSGAVLKTQRVGPGGSATAPAYVKYPGYKFVRWDTSYTNVQSDVDVYTVYELGPIWIRKNGQWTAYLPEEGA